MIDPQRMPQTIDPIAYRQGDDAHPLLPIVRILAVAIILSAALDIVRIMAWRSSLTSALQEIFLRWPNGKMGIEQWQAIVIALAIGVDIALIVAAVACVSSRSNTARLATIIFCWVKIGLTFSESGFNLVIMIPHLSRLPSGYIQWTYLPLALAGSFSQAVLPATTAIMLATAALRPAFSRRIQVFDNGPY